MVHINYKGGGQVQDLLGGRIQPGIPASRRPHAGRGGISRSRSSVLVWNLRPCHHIGAEPVGGTPEQFAEEANIQLD
jgi:hypothetical protein